MATVAGLDTPARIYLLPARTAPSVLVIRRKPTKLFHIMRWNTRRNTLEHGSWFRGRLFPYRCDVSFDGQWMVYLAMGSTGETWNGVCQPPHLRTVAECCNGGTWCGGGYWRDHTTLCLNNWKPTQGTVPFQIAQIESQFGMSDLGMLYSRWERDGWCRRGESVGKTRRTAARQYTTECVGDDGWQNKPPPQHTALVARYAGRFQHGETFRYHLLGHGDLIDDDVDSACWDSGGRLLFSRRGVLHRYTLEELRTGRAGAAIDLEGLQPPNPPQRDADQ